MDPLIGSALIGAGTGLLNNVFGASATNQQNAANMRLAKYQWEKNVEMWNMQNEYNSPSAQMERYRAAGLNPNLVATQGSSGNASSIPQYQAPTVSKYQMKFDNVLDNMMKMFSVISNKEDLNGKQLQNELLRQEVADHSAEIQQRVLKRLHERDSWAIDLALKQSQTRNYNSRSVYQDKVTSHYDEEFNQKMKQSFLTYDFLEATLGARVAQEWARAQNLINDVDFYQTKKRGAILDNDIKEILSKIHSNELFESNHWKAFMEKYGEYIDESKLYHQFGYVIDPVDGKPKKSVNYFPDKPSGYIDKGVDFLSEIYKFLTEEIIPKSESSIDKLFNLFDSAIENDPYNLLY